MEFHGLNTWLVVQLDDFAALLDRADPKLVRDMGAGLSDADRSTLLLQFDTINRATYLTKFMFDVEHLVTSLIVGVGEKPKTQYGALCRQLVRSLGMDPQPSLDALLLPAYVRNSLHNNGFASQGFDFEINGTPYAVPEGEQIRFAGWNNLRLMVEALSEALLLILEREKLASR